MKKKIVSLFLILALTMGMTAAVSFADNGAVETNPQSTVAIGFTTDRISNTKASASVFVQFTAEPDSYIISLTLQKKTSSGWTTATDVSGYRHVYHGSGKSGLLTYEEWTVKKGAVYRVKCESTDIYNDGIQYTRTAYSDPF